MTGKHFAVVGTNDGTICFFSLPDGIFIFSVSLDERIDRLEVVADAPNSKYLLIQAGMPYRLQLEAEEETAEEGFVVVTVLTSSVLQQRGVKVLGGGWTSSVSSRGMEPVGQFSRTTQFRAQRQNNSKLLVGAHDPCSGHRLQMFTPSLDIVSPLFVLQLAPGIVDCLLFDTVTVSATAGREAKIIVGSNLLSFTSVDADEGAADAIQKQSVLQTLELPHGQRTRRWFWPLFLSNSFISLFSVLGLH